MGNMSRFHLRAHQGCARTIDGSLYDKNGMAPSFDFYRISQILDRLDGITQFGVQFGLENAGCWGNISKLL